ncbi:hypothetical protein M758_8G090700 [Ceratodon purpureus]|nr:hypothetical protein M758_8G090700 [Ceratodon purpureus]
MLGSFILFFPLLSVIDSLLVRVWICSFPVHGFHPVSVICSIA